nr:hypothetical protein [Sphingobium yanoikuyae]
MPDIKSRAAHAKLDDAKWRQVSWRRETKGCLTARFAAMRVGITDGEPQRIETAGTQYMRREEPRLVREHRSNGDPKYCLSNLPSYTATKNVAGAIKGLSICEQAHHQSRRIGLDHLEGRSCDLAGRRKDRPRHAARRSIRRPATQRLSCTAMFVRRRPDHQTLR